MGIGIGLDVASIERIAKALERHGARFAERILTDAERGALGARSTDPTAVAGRFAAKEAVAKALGAPEDVWWHDVQVLVGRRGAPVLELVGKAEEHARRLRVTRQLVSITHDAGVAAAMVVLESDAGGPAA